MKNKKEKSLKKIIPIFLKEIKKQDKADKRLYKVGLERTLDSGIIPDVEKLFFEIISIMVFPDGNMSYEWIINLVGAYLVDEITKKDVVNEILSFVED